MKDDVVKEKQLTVSKDILKDQFYLDLLPLEKLAMRSYINEKVNLYGNCIGFNSLDAIITGFEIPNKYLIEYKG
jgi:hypothetical protein